MMRTIYPEKPCMSFNEWQEHLRREREVYRKIGRRDVVQDESEVPQR